MSSLGPILPTLPTLPILPTLAILAIAMLALGSTPLLALAGPGRGRAARCVGRIPVAPRPRPQGRRRR